MSTKTLSKSVESSEVDVVEESKEEEKILSDSEIEMKVFQYGALISVALWAYIFIKGGDALYFIIPAILITLTVSILFIRYRKRRESTGWVGESFKDYKTEKFNKSN